MWKCLLTILAVIGVIQAKTIDASASLISPPWLIHSVLKGTEDGPARSAFVRGETVCIIISVTVPTQTLAKINGQVRLAERGGPVVWEKTWSLARPAAGGSPVKVILPSEPWRTGTYDVGITVWSESSTVQTNMALWICPEPDRTGFVFGMLNEQIRRGSALTGNLDDLKAMGFSAAMHYQPTPEFMEACLRQGVNGLAILHGGGFKGTRESILRLNAQGIPFGQDPQKPESGRWGISHPEWQAAAAAQMETHVRKWVAYPGFWPMINTSDDYYQWTGMDYNSNNVTAFQGRYGIEPPRPPEALLADYPMQVAHPTGVLPDTEPWVLWQTFHARDVLGRYNGLLAEAVSKATGEMGKIGPVCGGGPRALGTIPLVDLPSGQWPPYNFGTNHFSLISYYNYNCYWFPALVQVWWAELARMGNRTMPVWVMPDTMDLRRTYHLQNAWLLLAGGVDGMVYFLYERMSPGSREALRRIGPEIAQAKALLSELQPAPRRLGLLMPFETACFNASHPTDTSYAFANLTMAHAEVEPVWPEELPDRGNRYRAVLLHNVDWLTAGNAQRLQDFQQQGGRVIADSETAVHWPGMEHLDFALAQPKRDGGYGDTLLIEKIRKVMGDIVEPWAQSGDPHLLLRHFQLDGVDYLWVVHLMNQEEDRAHLHADPGREFKVEPLVEYAEFDQRHYSSRFSVPSGSFRRVADVVGRHPPVKIRAVDNRSEIDLQIPWWQGRLLAFYPENPEGIYLQLPGTVRRGKPVAAQIEIRSQRRPVPMTLPLAIEFIQPDGVLNTEYSRTLLARRGRARLRLDFAQNEMAGEWIVRVREYTTDIQEESRFIVQ